jgi:hypothetical protein
VARHVGQDGARRSAAGLSGAGHQAAGVTLQRRVHEGRAVPGRLVPEAAPRPGGALAVLRLRRGRDAAAAGGTLAKAQELFQEVVDGGTGRKAVPPAGEDVQAARGGQGASAGGTGGSQHAGDSDEAPLCCPCSWSPCTSRRSRRKAQEELPLLCVTFVFNYCLHLLKTAQIKEEDDD